MREPAAGSALAEQFALRFFEFFGVAASYERFRQDAEHHPVFVEDREFVGIEQDPGYVEIAEARISYWAGQLGEEADRVPLEMGR